MKLLILGESDSIGMALADPAQAWGHRVPVELADITGEAPEATHVRFYSWADGSLAYLETILARGPFDAVVISATKVGFTVFSADNRVRKVFGDRVGDWFKTSANTFDRNTRWRKPPGLKRNINELAHRALAARSDRRRSRVLELSRRDTSKHSGGSPGSKTREWLWWPLRQFLRERPN